MGVKVQKELAAGTAAREIDIESRGASEAYRWMLVINGPDTYEVAVKIFGNKDSNYYVLANGGAVAGSGAPYLFEGWIQSVQITPSAGGSYTAVLVGGVDGAR